MKHPSRISRRLVALLSVILLTASSWNAQGQPKKKAAPKSGAMAPVEDIAGLPRVLLIGDSISIGYTVPVRDMLKEKANVHRPLTNCGPTTKGLESLDAWLATGGADKKWDLIHFNWGLHDLKYMGPNGENLADPEAETSKQQVPPDAYRENLKKLVDRLEKTGAVLIWRNTTPVPPGCKGRVVGDSDLYNEIAREIMEAKDIATHDLYTFSLKHQKKIQKPANVHFTAEGSKALGKEVADLIEKTLNSRNGN